MLDFGNRIKSGKRNNDNDSDDLFSSGSEEENEDVFEETSDAADDEPENDDEEAVEHLRRASARKKRSRRDMDDDELDKLEAANILTEARKRMGISPADVEEITKIRAVYINALESGRFDELPQAVYTLAYLRRLCELYALSAEEEEQITAPWSDIQCETPERYSGPVFADETGENSRIIRRLEVAIFSVIAIAVIALVVFGVILLVSFLRGSGSSRTAFDENNIVKLQPQVKLQVNEPLPSGRRIR